METIFHRPFYTMQALWEYRKWFLMLTDKQLKAHPTLACGVLQILIISGELDKARELVEMLPKDSVYQMMAKLSLPGVD